MDRLAAMEAFVRVVEANSFSRAAVELRRTQSVVSKAVVQLEGRLGVRLLLRSTHGLTPTEAGQALYEQAKLAVEAAEAAELAARGANAGMIGHLRVAAAVTFGRLHIMPYLGLLLADHPALEIELLLDDSDIDLRKAGIDVAFRLGNLADSPMTAQRIDQARRLVVATPAYYATAG